MAKEKKKKDKWDVLAETFKAEVNAADEVAVRKIIASVALEHAALMAAQLDDKAWEEAKDNWQMANQVYAESKKFTPLKIAYCRHSLKNRGANVK